MPELPEVETVRRTLAPHLVGRCLRSVEILDPKVVRGMTEAEFSGRLSGRAVRSIGRRGKYLVFDLDGGEALIAHLRMTGRLVYLPARSPAVPYTRVLFRLDGDDRLVYADLRRLGGLYLRESVPPGFHRLGPEPLAAEWTAEEFCRALAGRRGKIKAVLLDQRFLAGLGNIYADECLFAAGINPERAASSLDREECRALHAAIRSVLERAVGLRGTTFSDYVDGEGRTGSYAGALNVYRRTGEACLRCGTAIQRRRIGGRSSHYCPCCQR